MNWMFVSQSKCVLEPVALTIKSGQLLQEEKGLVLGKTKSDVEAAVNRVAVVAVRRTHPPRSVVPRTTAKGILTGRNRTLLLTPVIALRVCRTRPLPHVAQHIKEPESVGFEASHRSRLLATPTTAALVTVGVVPADPITPVTGRLRLRTCRVLPLRCHCRRQ